MEIIKDNKEWNGYLGKKREKEKKKNFGRKLCWELRV